ncbi:NisI/SpaI family lantibiotic immunity lipoprotein [Anaerosporobacter sp.]
MKCILETKKLRKNFKHQKARYVVSLFLGICLINISGCSKTEDLFDIAIENVLIEKDLPKGELNKETFSEFTLGDETYAIIGNEISVDSIDVPIGKINEYITIDEDYNILDKVELRKTYIVRDNKVKERYILSFGWLYSVKDFDTSEKVAVVLNSKYMEAVSK